jgi:hypothetical protein
MNAVDPSRRFAPAENGGVRAVGPPAGLLSRRLGGFAAALEDAAREYLASRGVAPAEEYRLLVEECPVHGPGCARVTYGMLRQHVVWARGDATELAAGMLGTMLPHERKPAL